MIALHTLLRAVISLVPYRHVSCCEKKNLYSRERLAKETLEKKRLDDFCHGNGSENVDEEDGLGRLDHLPHSTVWILFLIFLIFFFLILIFLIFLIFLMEFWFVLVTAAFDGLGRSRGGKLLLLYHRTKHSHQTDPHISVIKLSLIHI